MERIRKAKGRLLDEMRKFAWIVGYIWVAISLFDLHKLLVLRAEHLDSRFVFTIGTNLFNALVLGKVVLIGDHLRLAERIRHRALIYLILCKAAVFSLLLVCFNVVEEVLTGVLHGRTLAESVPPIGGGGLEGKFLAGTIIFLVLIPFFAFAELRRALGPSVFDSLVFEHPAKAGIFEERTHTDVTHPAAH